MSIPSDPHGPAQGHRRLRFSSPLNNVKEQMSHPETQEHFRRTDFIPDRSRAKSPGSVEVLGAVRVSGGVDGRYIGRTPLACQRACESFLTVLVSRRRQLCRTGFSGLCLTADTVRHEAEQPRVPLLLRSWHPVQAYL